MQGSFSPKGADEDYNTYCEDLSEIERERIWIESYKDDYNSLINDIAEIKENIAELEEELKGCNYESNN